MRVVRIQKGLTGASAGSFDFYRTERDDPNFGNSP